MPRPRGAETFPNVEVHQDSYNHAGQHISYRVEVSEDESRRKVTGTLSEASNALPKTVERSRRTIKPGPVRKLLERFTPYSYEPVSLREQIDEVTDPLEAKAERINHVRSTHADPLFEVELRKPGDER